MSGTAATDSANDRRVQQMIKNPNRYFAKAREDARKEAAEAFRREAEIRKQK